MGFDFASVSSPFRMQPGLRRIGDGAHQLTPQRPGDPALVAKLAVLERHAAQALLSMAHFDARPALSALCRQAHAEHPDAFAFDGEAACARLLGWAVRGDGSLEPRTAAGHESDARAGRCLAALPAEWRLAGLVSLAFAEDFAVLDARTGRLAWMAVCLPSHWAPESKIGRHFTEVHAPVADNALLLTASEHLMRLVTGGDRWERFVWTIAPRPALDAHPARLQGPGWPVAATADDIAARAFWRTERQTFLPVAGQGQAVFTIHVEVTPLARAISSPASAARVHAALASMSPAVLAYRGLAAVQPALLDWLSRRTGT